MAHHRCTRCKEEVGIRHKYAGGLFCEPCMRAVGAMSGRGIRGFFSDIWRRVRSFVSAPFKPKPPVKDVAVKVAYSVMKARTRDILPDARTMNPQKR